MTPTDLRTMWRDRRQRERLYSTPDYWDSKAKQFSGDSASMWPNPNLNQLYHEEQMRHLRHFVPAVKEFSILDVGCGTGRISRFLAACGARVQGIDFSVKATQTARGLTDGANPAYRVQSVFCLEEREIYDVAVTTGSLVIACKDEQDLRAALDRVRQALKPAGKLIMLEPIHDGFLHRVLNLNFSRYCEIVRQSGFQIEETRQMHFWPARLFLAFIPWPGWFTRLGYGCGQKLMNLPGFSHMGDYKAMCAKVAAPST